ncbi:hypothetical protein [Phyllobacterium myrsinacearum]|uniref:Uncharacterized protein n=1 Tax=Phyllobacterium myrsinacearum TaxID=28101 RepID=A0A839EJU0_9HYPH|nr:hypothetical protein [Phyllobacterium myrsinacearum]MBA8876767.1 hypothetical protein [Phyllobacterium myrsinacearum]
MTSIRLKWLGYVILVAVMPLAFLAATLPVNEYKAQGIDGVDCDGPLQVLFFTVPILFVYGTGLVLNVRALQKPVNLAVAIICFGMCLFVGLNVAAAVREQQQKSTVETCSRGL